MALQLEEAPKTDMGKSKGKPARRQQNFLVLPPDYLAALQDFKETDGRPMTMIGQIALEMFFRAVGRPFEENWTGWVNDCVAKLKAHK